MREWLYTRQSVPLHQSAASMLPFRIPDVDVQSYFFSYIIGCFVRNYLPLRYILLWDKYKSFAQYVSPVVYKHEVGDAGHEIDAAQSAKGFVWADLMHQRNPSAGVTKQEQLFRPLCRLGLEYLVIQ